MAICSICGKADDEHEGQFCEEFRRRQKVENHQDRAEWLKEVTTDGK